MKAGVDFGTTLTKVAWRKQDGSYGFLSTADIERVAVDDWKPVDFIEPGELLGHRLVELGVTEACAVGIGARCLPAGIVLRERGGDGITGEIAAQARGARLLLASAGNAVQRFLLVSVGTGTSYALVGEGEPRHFPIGNAIGGGFLSGVSNIAGFGREETLDRFAESAARGVPQDLLVKDLIPGKAGSFEGNLVVANFGKYGRRHDEPSSPEDYDTPWDRLGPDVCATIVHCVAVSVIRDVMLIGMIDGFGPVEDVVFIGTPVARIGALATHLARYAAALGKRAHFPKGGEYAAALGALHAAEST